MRTSLVVEDRRQQHDRHLQPLILLPPAAVAEGTVGGNYMAGRSLLKEMPRDFNCAQVPRRGGSVDGLAHGLHGQLKIMERGSEGVRVFRVLRVSLKSRGSMRVEFLFSPGRTPSHSVAVDGQTCFGLGIAHTIHILYTRTGLL